MPSPSTPTPDPGLLTRLAAEGFESLHHYTDGPSGLQAIVAIHSTVLGPALGGTRALATYNSEAEALTDVIRLARAMTYKAALCGVDHGGGKAVIVLPKGRIDRAALFAAFGRAVESLGGRYITTEDSGTSPEDMAIVRRTTRHVVGLNEQSGDPSPVTALGVARGIEAAARLKLGRSDLQGMTVSIQGLGRVGSALAQLLRERGCRLQVADLVKERVARARDELGATPLTDESIFTAVADVFAPCALGAVLNDQTIPKLNVRIVAGASNNQLAEPRHGEALSQRNITYVPDYAINAGGLINVAEEVLGYQRERALRRAGDIYETVTRILQRSRSEGRRPEQVADRMAEERIATVLATR